MENNSQQASENNSKAGDTKKIQIILMAVIALIFVASICTLLIIRFGGKNSGAVATIYVDGNIYREISLQDSGDEIILIESATHPGEYNKIEIKNHDIHMLEASCPDKLCVNQGFASNTRIPIVCLPNNVTITVTYSNDEVPVDVITY